MCKLDVEFSFDKPSIETIFPPNYFKNKQFNSITVYSLNGIEIRELVLLKINMLVGLGFDKISANQISEIETNLTVTLDSNSLIFNNYINAKINANSN